MRKISRDGICWQRMMVIVFGLVAGFCFWSVSYCAESKNKMEEQMGGLEFHEQDSINNGSVSSTGEVVVEHKRATSALQGWYTSELTHKQFRFDVTTETIKHQIVQGDDAGGRVNLEVGNIFHGGAGDDLVVT